MAYKKDVPGFGFLEGVKVVFTGQAVAGPFAAEMWAENGADVIWIENPRNPDEVRSPMALVGERDRLNMRTIALNLVKPEGQEALLKMLADTDIFLEASRGGQFAGWGLTDEKLWSVNPQLVIVHISGFGQTGVPDYVHRASWDTIGQAFSGYLALNGTPEEPISAKPQLCDYITAQTACWSGLAALHKAQATGEGDSLDIAMYEAMLRVSSDAPQQYATNGTQPARSVSGDARSAGYRCYRCKDGKFVALVMVGPAAMKGVLPLLGLEWGSEDFPKKFPVIFAGTPGAEKFETAMEAWCLERTADQAQAEILATGAPAQKVNEYADIVNDAHVKARGSLLDVEDPDRGTVKGAVAPVPKVARHPQKLWRTQPALGADTRDILAEVGYTDDQIERLAEQGIVKAPQSETTDRTVLTNAG